MIALIVLLVVYQIKHFLADYPLQGKYMLGKFKPGLGFILPLSAHCAVHAAFTFVIAYLFMGFKYEMMSQSLTSMGLPVSQYALCTFALKMAGLDAGLHFIMDRIKADPKLLGRFQAITKKDYYEHIQKIADMTTRMNQLSATQEGLVAAADVHAQINEAQVDWMDTMRSNTLFWWSLGIDQMVHHLTHYLIIFIMLGV